MPEYRFSPILNETDFQRVLSYLAATASELIQTVIGTHMLLDTLTIFAHDDQEYEFIEKLVRHAGGVSRFTHGTTLYVDTDLTIDAKRVQLVGVRKPDPERPQVGYADFPITNFADMQTKLASNPYVRPIQAGSGIPLLEIAHPEFDTLAYLVSEATRLTS